LNLNAMTQPTKKSKAPRPFAAAHKACQTPEEREELAIVIQARWTEAELHEYARLFFFRNKKDYATPASLRRAILDVAGCVRWICNDEPPSHHNPIAWLKLFRKGGSKPLPPRREGLLIRSRGQLFRVSHDEYAWTGHTEKFRALIEQEARDYFKLGPDTPLHPNAWAAAYRAHGRSEANEAAKARAAKAPKVRKKPRKKPHKLPPQFNRNWPGHTDAFRQEVDQRVRDDRRLPPGASVGPGWWKIACHKYYELTDVAAE
jgi:hypothetical protein